MTIEVNGNTYYSTDEACKYLGVSRETLHQMSKDGRLNKYRQGFTRTVYYSKEEMDSLKAVRKVEPDEDR